MLLTLKNKMMVAMDKMISDAKGRGGIPDRIDLYPQEAADFLREISKLRNECKKNIRIEQTHEDVVVTVGFMLTPELTRERLQQLIKQWYKGDFQVYYKGIKLKVTKNKKPDVPEPQGPVAADDTGIVRKLLQKIGLT